MYKTIQKLCFAAVLLCGAMTVTSCTDFFDAVFGTVDHSSGKNNNSDKDKPVVKATDLLKDAQKEGATVVFWFHYEGNLYHVVFKKVGNEYVFQNGGADTQAMTRTDWILDDSNTIKGLGGTVEYNDTESASRSVGGILINVKFNSDNVLQTLINFSTGEVTQKTSSSNTYLSAMAIIIANAGLEKIMNEVRDLIVNTSFNPDNIKDLENVMLLTADDNTKQLLLQTLSEIKDYVGKQGISLEEALGKVFDNYQNAVNDNYVTPLGLKIAPLPSYGKKTDEYGSEVLGETNNGKSLIVGWQKETPIALIHGKTMDILTVKEVDGNGATLDGAITDPVDGEKVHIVYAGSALDKLNDLKRSLEGIKSDITKADIDAWVKDVMNSTEQRFQSGSLDAISRQLDLRYAEAELKINKDGTAEFKSVPTLEPLCAIWKIIPTGDLTTFQLIRYWLSIDGADIVLLSSTPEPYIYVVILPGEYTTLKFDAYNAENKDIHYYCTVNNASFKAGDFITSKLNFSLPLPDNTLGNPSNYNKGGDPFK